MKWEFAVMQLIQDSDAPSRFKGIEVTQMTADGFGNSHMEVFPEGLQIEDVPNRERAYLHAMGMQGWELVSIDELRRRIWFKRPTE